MKWPEYQMSQLTSHFISGGTPSTKVREYWEGEIPWITGADIVNGEVALGRRYINEAAITSSATNIVPRGSILMVTRTGVGKIAIAPVDIAISQDFTGIVLKESVDPKFVLAAIKSRMGILLAVQRGATIKGVTRHDVRSLSIPLPAPAEQRHIVEILDHADALRKKRSEADAKAARILPALYHKIFGDPIGYPKRWKQTPLGQVVRKKTGALQSGPFGSQLHNHDFVANGTVLAVGVDNVHDTGFEWGRERRITEKKYNELKKFTLEPEDVLITIMGTVGRTCVFPEWAVPAICTKHVYRIQVDRDRLHPEYLCAAIRFSSSVRSQLGSSVTGQIVAGITSRDLRGLRIDEPPIELQQKFAEVKAGLDQDRRKRLRNCEELDRLFNVLLPRAFTGDLTAKWRMAHMKELLAEMEAQTKCLSDAVH